MNLDQGFQLKDLRKMLRRRAPIAAGVAGFVMLAVLFVVSILPNQYEAYITILVEPQVISKELIKPGMEESNLNERLHLMTMQILSRPRLSKVIDEFHLYPEESKRLTREEVIDFMKDRIHVEPVLPEMEKKLSVLQRSSREIEINTFRLFYRHENPEIAAAVANRLGNDFVEEHIKERVQISGDTSDFIENELTRLQSRIQEVEGKVAGVKAQNPGRLPEDMDANQRLLEQAMANLRSAQRDLAESESDEAFYKQQALTAGAAAPPVADDADPARRVEVLQIKLGEARAHGLTDKHPDVMALEEEIASLKEKLAQSGSNGPPMSLPQQNAEAERRRATLRAESARGEIDRISKQVQDVEQRINDTPRVAEELAALDREYRHLYESYQDYSTKRLEAGVAANMERRQKGEQFRVLESAFPPPDPSSPNRPVLLAVGAMLGLALGAGLGVLLEGADSSFHEPRQVQASLNIPVLAAVPAILLDADRAALRRQRLRLGLATGMLVVLVLVSSAGGYLWVNGRGGAAGQAESSTAAPAPETPAAVAPGATNQPAAGVGGAG